MFWFPSFLDHMRRGAEGTLPTIVGNVIVLLVDIVDELLTIHYDRPLAI